MGREWLGSELSASSGRRSATRSKCVLQSTPGRLELVNGDGPRRALGGEAFLRYVAGPLQVIGSYTYLDVTEADARRRAARGGPGAAPDGGTRGPARGRGARPHRRRDFLHRPAEPRWTIPYRTSSPSYVEVNALAEIRSSARRPIFLNAINLTECPPGPLRSAAAAERRERAASGSPNCGRRSKAACSTWACGWNSEAGGVSRRGCGGRPRGRTRHSARAHPGSAGAPRARPRRRAASGSGSGIAGSSSGWSGGGGSRSSTSMPAPPSRPDFSASASAAASTSAPRAVLIKTASGFMRARRSRLDRGRGSHP